MSQVPDLRGELLLEAANDNDLTDEQQGSMLPVIHERPRTRGECPETRPCPWVSCKYHLYLDVRPRFGRIKLTFPDLEPWEMPETCALDVADRASGEGTTLQEVGKFLNITRERVRQIEESALGKLRAVKEELE